MPYVELHCHSAYSFLDGASQPDELVARAADLGYPALALTDHDGVYGSLEFAHAAKALGLRAITGAEVTVRLAAPERPAGTSGPLPTAPTAHLTLLVETQRGYATLCRLLTEAHALTRLPGAEKPETTAPPAPRPRRYPRRRPCRSGGGHVASLRPRGLSPFNQPPRRAQAWSLWVHFRVRK